MVRSALGPAAIVSVSIPPGSKYALGFANSGVSRESEIYFVPVAELATTPNWKQLASLEDKVARGVVGADGDTAWLLTFRGAPRGKLSRIDLDGTPSL